MAEPTGALINVSSANALIEDFLNNNYDEQGGFGTINVKSFMVDATLLRQYLSNNNIRNMKVMLGSVTSDGVTRPTLIFAGVDASGNYVKAGANDDMVLDHVGVCPPRCPTVGSAQNDTIS